MEVSLRPSPVYDLRTSKGSYYPRKRLLHPSDEVSVAIVRGLSPSIGTDRLIIKDTG